MCARAAGPDKGLAGHAQIATVLKHYANIMPEALQAAQERLPFKNMTGICTESAHGDKDEQPVPQHTEVKEDSST